MNREQAQAVLEYLTTYGAAFLIMTALVAGIIALDPLGQDTGVELCTTTSSSTRCQEQRIRASDTAVELPLENTESQTINAERAEVTSVNGENISVSCDGFPRTLSSGETATITCPGLDLVSGQTNGIEISYEEHRARVGDEYSQPQEAKVRVRPSTGVGLGPSAVHDEAPDNHTMILQQMGGNGTLSQPYIITNDWELSAMRADQDAHYALGNDISLRATEQWHGGEGWHPIKGTWSNPFHGSLDGRGRTITDFYMDRPSNVAYYDGLFKVFAGNITDVSFTDAEIVSDTWGAGVVAGTTYDPDGIVSMRNIEIETDIDAYEWGGTGGVVGAVNSQPYQLRNSVVTINMTVNGAAWDYFGGLLGASWYYEDVNITNSESHGTISLGDYGPRGWAGGLLGGDGGNIKNSASDVDIHCVDCGWDIGGLVGIWFGGNITNSRSTGLLNVTNATEVGGLVGGVGTSYSPGINIVDSYSTSVVNAQKDVGGFAGEMFSSSTRTSISRSFAAGPVSATTGVGGFIGNFSGGEINNSYYDRESTGQTSSPGGAALNTSQMTGNQAPGNMDGFNFTTTWKTTNSYPELRD